MRLACHHLRLVSGGSAGGGGGGDGANMDRAYRAMGGPAASRRAWAELVWALCEADRDGDARAERASRRAIAEGTLAALAPQWDGDDGRAAMLPFAAFRDAIRPCARALAALDGPGYAPSSVSSSG